MCIFLHLVIQNEHSENSRCYVLRPAWVQRKHSTFSCHERATVLHLKARCWVGDGCEQDKRICVQIDQWGTKLAVPFFSLPSLLCFFPFSWGFYSWKTGVKHWKYWKLGMAEEQNITSLTCWVLGFYSLGYSVTPGLAWESLVFFLCYFALSSPPMQVVLPAAV